MLHAIKNRRKQLTDCRPVDAVNWLCLGGLRKENQPRPTSVLAYQSSLMCASLVCRTFICRSDARLRLLWWEAEIKPPYFIP